MVSVPHNPSVLITGANRGLGLALAKHYACSNWRVIASCRQSSNELDELATSPNVNIESLDVGDESSIEDLAERIQHIELDVLINNAGIDGHAPAHLSDIKAEDFMHCLRVNSLGPLLLSRALADNVGRSQRRVITNISSRLGSIEANDWGRWYVYGTSKTALNRISVQLASSLAYRKITVIALHPGWVSTDMGGAQGPVTPMQSAAGIYTVIDELDFEHSGSFCDFTGASWPW